MRPQKSELAQTRLTVGGNLIYYPAGKSTPTADIFTFKTLVNSTLSTPNAKMCCMDVKNYYLNTPLDRPEYMRINIALIPTEIHISTYVANHVEFPSKNCAPIFISSMHS
jgi:hypothetical protein